MNNSFKSLIDSAKSILILLPTKPTFDQVAAGLALSLVLRQQKETVVVSPTPMTVDFNRLVGVNKITKELGNKNMVIQFAEYKATDIERVSYDIEEGRFRLTVIPKPGINAPQKDQVEFSYSGVSSDMAILIGGANEADFPAAFSGELATAKPVHIGVRALSTQKKIVSFGQAASSDSEIMASLIYQSGWKVDSDVATNLLMGIEDGSQKFSVPEVNANTFAIVSELMRAGGSRVAKTGVSASSYPPGAIPGQAPQQLPLQQESQLTGKPVQKQHGGVNQPSQVKQQGLEQQVSQSQPSVEPTQSQIQDQQSSTQIRSDQQEKEKNPPKDWLKPKIFKGNSIN